MRRNEITEQFILDRLEVHPFTGCWNWTMGTDTGGYGRFKDKNAGRSAHRTAWKMWRGEIPSGVCVLHKCDNRRCCNPDHLFLGTKTDNNKDMHIKGRGRGAPGERNCKCKLRKEQVIEIIQSVEPRRVIAAKYGVSRTTIAKIKTRKYWKHLINQQPQNQRTE